MRIRYILVLLLFTLILSALGTIQISYAESSLAPVELTIDAMPSSQTGDAVAPIAKTGAVTGTNPNTTWYSTEDGAVGMRAGVAWPVPRFTDNSNGTVTDNLTGLIWLKNANCGGSGRNWVSALADVESLNTDGSMRGTDCGDVSNSGGHQTDWRLPNVREMASLLHYGHVSPSVPNTAGDGKCITDAQTGSVCPFDNLQIGSYWTSTRYAPVKTESWRVLFTQGIVDVKTQVNQGSHVWAVRGGIQSVGNTAPVVTISAPSDGATFTEGSVTSFAGTATDSEDGDLTANISWISSVDGAIGTGPTVNTSNLSVGNHVVTASVTDNEGVAGSESVAIVINSPSNEHPVVIISEPSNGSTFTEGDLISFTGTANDAEDGALTTSLAWTSSLDGSIGSGATFDISSLSVGNHIITASATDSGGATGLKSIEIDIDVFINQEPSVLISEPVGGTTFADGDSVTFTGAASDFEDGDLTPNITWTSDIDGAIGTGATFSKLDLSIGVHTITADVVDSHGGSDSATTNITISPGVSSPERKNVYVSSNTGGNVAGITFQDEDVLAYNTDTDTWSTYFDGTAYGLSDTDIDAFFIMDDGSLLMSIVDDGFDLGLGQLIDNKDIIRFVPATSTFELYFDGSQVGLDTPGENIVALALLADGSLLISTQGPFDVSGLFGADDDIMQFTPTQLGTTTVGTWSRYFDGSDVDMSDVDISSLWIDPVTGDILFTTGFPFNINGVTGGIEDVVSCVSPTIGESSACSSISIAWLGTDLSGELVDAIAFGPAETTIATPGTSEMISPHETISESTPDFAWSPATDATGYTLVIYSVGTNNIIFSDSYEAGDICTPASCTAQPGITLNEGAYTWTVRANNQGVIGEWSTFP